LNLNGSMDIIGLDVVRDIENQYYLDSGEERDKSPKLLDEMIAQTLILRLLRSHILVRGQGARFSRSAVYDGNI